MKIMGEGHTKRLACIPAALILAILSLVGTAGAQNKILYTTQTNPPAPNVPPGSKSYDPTLAWASHVCSDNNLPMPSGSEIEWASVLDPGQDAETNLVAVSGTAVYNPQPDESGFCKTGDPDEPKSCSSDSDCSSCGGFCDLAQGPSCSGGSCFSPWTNPQVGSPVACVNDAQCGPSGTCLALGRSRGDIEMTHPFGFDYDVAIAPDPDYEQLLSSGNLESIHVDQTDSSGQTALPGFEDIVYPYLHATSGITKGWCSPKFDTRCTSSADCGAGSSCEGIIQGLGLGGGSKPLHGTLGLETDHDLIPETYQPRDGDRMVAFGRWIVDCGHGDDKAHTPGWHTEIHPPLLLATGRGSGSGFFSAKCSNEQTCSSVLGRPFLISQNFGDGPFAKHLWNELEKLGCVEVTGPTLSAAVAELGPYAGLPNCSLGLDPVCACNGSPSCIACEAASCLGLDTFDVDSPFGAPCTTQLEARPKVGRVPFLGKVPFGTQEMQYYIRPANDRINAGDRMLAKWRLTARDGVTVALSNSGEAGVLVDVTMDQSKYSAADLPPKQDWVKDPGELSPALEFAGFLDLFGLFLPAQLQALIINRGLFTDRYQAPEAPLNDAAPSISFADNLDATVQAAQTIDDSQPFPVSGRINVGWFRCNPGGPYVAECKCPESLMG
jgi:hypothetical protein